MATIAVIGGGAWGTALACHAARHDHSVRLWAREPSVVEAVEQKHENSTFLPRVPLPAALRASTNIAHVLDGADLVIFVPPAQHLRAIAELARSHVPANATIVVASKGLEERSLKLLRDVLSEVMPEAGDDRVAFLSGPSFAREVARGLPTDVVVASAHKTAALCAQRWLHSPLFRVYTSEDVVGVEVGGAVKNVIAIAAGACDGLRLGTNAHAALVTRGLAEITRLGVALGADPLTFLGMAGAGDLFLTCGGALSRNRTLGFKIAEGIDARAWIASQTSVAEGFYTTAAARNLSQKLDVEMPITAAVYAVLYEGVPLLEAIRALLTRGFKDEQLGLVRPG
jgi:glycerol-3-phosphate dehydrogenase (NAD(P)+)